MDVYLLFRQRNVLKRRQIRNHRALLLELRLKSSPFDLPDVRFVQLFRLDKLNARTLMEKLQQFTQVINTTIPFHIKFLSTLHFYGYGSYQTSIGSSHIFGLSQPSTSRSIHVVTDLINAHLLNDAIKFPSGIFKTAEIKRQFSIKFNMPGIISVIDGTHIPIIAPPHHGIDGPGHLYVNRKGYHSLNVLAITDANLKVIYADARYPGSVHDSAIWMVSPVRRLLQGAFTTAENQRSHIIGDSGFPLEPWLLTPINNPPQGSLQSAFNKRFLTTRNSVERAFGVIKSRFRCLSRHRVLHYSPERAAKIAYAVFCIHNLYTMGQEEFLDDPDDLIEIDEHEDENYEETQRRNRNEWHRIGSRVRERYVANLI